MVDIEAGSFNFAFNLYKELKQNAPNTNLVVSPFSLSSALAMTLYGARGNTATDLGKTLFSAPNFSEASVKSIVPAFERLVQKGVIDNSKVLNVANFLYAQKDYNIKEDFQKTLEKSFAATSKRLDFSAPDSVTVVNDDIATATKGKIKNLLSGLDPMTRLILANAVYFKGTWKTKFNADKTKKERFNMENNAGAVDVDMMFMKQKLQIGYSDELKVCRKG